MPDPSPSEQPSRWSLRGIVEQIGAFAGNLRAEKPVPPAQTPENRAERIAARLEQAQADPDLRARLKGELMSARAFLGGELVGINLSSGEDLYYHDPSEPLRPWHLAPAAPKSLTVRVDQVAALHAVIDGLDERTLPYLSYVVEQRGILMVHLSPRRSMAIEEYSAMHGKLHDKWKLNSTYAEEFKIYRSPVDRDISPARFVRLFRPAAVEETSLTETEPAPPKRASYPTMMLNFSGDTLYYLRHFSDETKDVALDPVLAKRTLELMSPERAVKAALAFLTETGSKNAQWLAEVAAEKGLIVLFLPPDPEQRAMISASLRKALQTLPVDFKHVRILELFYGEH